MEGGFDNHRRLGHGGRSQEHETEARCAGFLNFCGILRGDATRWAYRWDVECLPHGPRDCRSLPVLGVASLGNTGFGLTNAFHLRMRIALTWGMVAAR